ncbi:MAG: cytidine deaminase, partial [Clostridia bacterium]|nr:cytidine deaminase [Clostridia bacterium]
GHSLEREICYLAAHSFFHLFGYDHMTDEDKRVMREKEKLVMKAMNLEGEFMTNDQLFERACKALEKAYVPYSGFRVGACLLDADGNAFDGCNFENASYGAAICAERCAVSNAIISGSRRFVAIAVAGEEVDAWPCGICRQVLSEFSQDMIVICGNACSREYAVKKLAELLPMNFGPAQLGKNG